MILEERIYEYLDESIECINDLKKKSHQIEQVIQIFQKAKKNNNKVFLLGNGGSAATASHLICDLNKFRGLRAIALTDSIPLITAWGNDEDYSAVFKEQLRTLADTNDIVVGFSGSGNSKNVIDAMKYAKAKGCYTIGFAGYDGGILKDIADECIIVDVNNMQHSEDMHVLLGHMIAFLLEDNREVKPLEMRAEEY
jgi:D-sedoheptulose 7-phosphate isomerase